MRSGLAMFVLGYFLLGGSGWAQALHFPGFSDSSMLTFDGTAAVTNTVDGHVLRLVPAATFQAGSAFSGTPINAASFSTFFTFRFLAPGGVNGGADGFVFVVQSIGPRPGIAGGGMGYQGITNSVGVEFDIFHNGPTYNDPSASHVGINVGGTFSSAPGETNTATLLPDMKAGGRWFAWIDYQGSVLEVRVNQTGLRPELPLVTRTVDIPAEIKGLEAYVGFTGATGGGYADHDILAWQYNTPFEPIGGLSADLNLRILPALRIEGSVGSTYGIEWTQDISGPTNWTILTNLVLPSSPFFFVDEAGPQEPQRFYRAVLR